jgi:hypothetical protein
MTERTAYRLKKDPDLTCPVCRKNFTGYVLSCTKCCMRCRKFIPFLLEQDMPERRPALWQWEVKP